MNEATLKKLSMRATSVKRMYPKHRYAAIQVAEKTLELIDDYEGVNSNAEYLRVQLHELQTAYDRLRQKAQAADDAYADGNHINRLNAHRDLHDELKPKLNEGTYIRFDGPPSHESGRFIETENEKGEGIKTRADWYEQEDGTFLLGPF